MQNLEISTVIRDYKYALDQLSEYDPNRDSMAFNLTRLAQEQRHKRRFWSFLTRIF